MIKITSNVGEILGNQKRLSLSQNSLYNTVGTIVYCFCQWVISSLLVIHLSPEETANNNLGILQLAISITNIFYAISIYNMRTYQISDVEGKYSNGDYIGMRFVTATISFVFCLVYVLIFKYSINDVLGVLFYMLYKMNETFSDVLHGIDQKHYRMDYVGISYILRGVLSVVSFAVTLSATGNVLLSIFVMAAASLAVVLFYDTTCAKQFGSVKPVFNKRTLLSLLLNCLPAVVSLVAFTAVVSIPRQVLEIKCGKEALGYYGVIAAPLVVVQVMVTSLFNPMLTQLSEFYNEGKIHDFLKQLVKALGVLAFIVAVVYLCVIFFGKFAVGLVFGQEYVPYTYLMYGIIACTALYVVSWLCTSVLIIMRSLKVSMVIILAALAVSAPLSMPLINLFYMNGVSYSVIAGYIIHIFVSAIVIIKKMKLKVKN